MAGKSEMIDLFVFPDKRFCPIRAMKKLKKSAKKMGFFSKIYQFSGSNPESVWQFPISLILLKNC